MLASAPAIDAARDDTRRPRARAIILLGGDTELD
jgi:hypothetical protein